MSFAMIHIHTLHLYKYIDAHIHRGLKIKPHGGTPRP